MWKPNRMMLAASALVAVTTATSSISNVPRPWAPWSLVSALPNLLAGSIAMPFLANEDHYVSPVALQIVGACTAGIFVALLFVVYAYRKIASKCIPQRSLVAFSIAGIANFLLLGFSWGYGVTYEGRLHTSVVVGYNVAALVGCIALYVHNRRAPSRATNLAFQTLFFVALGYCAFPWLGELL
jgi:hypothetical protein